MATARLLWLWRLCLQAVMLALFFAELLLVRGFVAAANALQHLCNTVLFSVSIPSDESGECRLPTVTN